MSARSSHHYEHFDPARGLSHSKQKYAAEMQPRQLVSCFGYV